MHSLVQNERMKEVDISDPKMDLSPHLPGVTCGDTLPAGGPLMPRIGVAKGQFIVPASFFEPLPDDALDAFECL